jgi:hypothetical protein
MRFVARLLLLPIAAPVIAGEAYEQHRPLSQAVWSWLTEGRLV